MIGFSGIFNVMTIYSPEIYPTKIRNITFSYTSFISRLSPICVPIFTQKFPHFINYSFILSAIIAGLIGITMEETNGKKLIAGLIGITMEETNGKKLLDIIPEEEEENENLKEEFLN